MNPSALTELFTSVVTLSWRAGWLIVVLAAVRLVVRGRVPAQVWFVAWILVGLRLLLPFSVPASWSPYNLAPSRAALAAPTRVEPAVATHVPSPSIPANHSASPAVVPIVTADAPRPRPVADAPVQSSSWTTRDALAAIWLGGVGVIAVARIVGSRNFRRRLRGARPASDHRLAALVARETGGARLAAMETDAVDAPALYGLLRPRLLLPRGLAEKLNDEELRHVVRHELGHWRRRDLLAQTLIQMAVAVHWFNPLAWLAARLARTDCELACDEHVLRREASAGAYGATLLKVLGVVGGRRRQAPVVAMLEGREQLTQRIRLIASYRPMGMVRVWAGIGGMALVAAASLTRETRAGQPAPAVAPRQEAAVTSATTVPQERAELLERARLQMEALRRPVEEQRRKIEEMQRRLQAHKEQSGAVSLDSRRDMASEKLKATNSELIRVGQSLHEAETRQNQLRDFQARKASLVELPFVASQPVVAQLIGRIAELKIQRATLSARYLEAHPMMLQISRKLEATEQQLSEAVAMVSAQIEAEAQALRSRQTQLQEDVRNQQDALAALERLVVEYGNHQRELALNEQLLQAIAARSLDDLLDAGGAAGSARGAVADGFTVSVVGAVNQQGAVRFPAGDHPLPLDAIARAGGFGPRANRETVQLVRLNPDGSRTNLTLTEAELMSGAGQAGSLRRGDIVVVPEKADR